jgi:hypothetical protein
MKVKFLNMTTHKEVNDYDNDVSLGGWFAEISEREPDLDELLINVRKTHHGVYIVAVGIDNEGRLAWSHDINSADMHDALCDLSSLRMAYLV